jgi:Zn-dependent protease with chaperone function
MISPMAMGRERPVAGAGADLAPGGGGGEPRSWPPQAEWPGSYLDGRTPTRQPVRIRLMPSGLEIALAEGTRVFWPYGQVRQTQGFYTGEPVRIERGHGLTEAVVVESPAFLTALRGVAGALGTRFHDPARRRRRVALTIVAAVAVGAVAAGAYAWGIPGLAALLAPRVPVAWEERLGDAALAEVAPPERRCRSADGERALSRMVEGLTRPLGPTPYAFRVHVLDSPRVNAFALPGGHVVLLRGLVERVREPGELAGVLAHELQHVLRRHGMRVILQHASVGLLITVLAGDPTGAMGYGIEVARSFGTLAYTRQAEEEADLWGARMLVAAGLDPGGLATFLEQLDDQGPMPSYLSSHPTNADRISRLRALAAPTPGAAPPPVDADGWQAIRAMCGTG